ncbi:Pls/PosA family non-ribosomal peptide synthetase [Pseudonocardia alaniniphila]|uniref:Phosphopantetheine-binding protein n=1 Tax=Pseudonocardia alaniniphila TaxID=75291 RepID=A0ABS9TBV4_9PSEU|nr:Pls/PosA family non-ribosomal peptide synthetase [Pseudonocardia alaniniphila]MCH6166008.1 phosphopantetheine-binding protein [Pseudonocardia alaniniphila]
MGESTEVLTDVVAESLTAVGGSLTTAHGGYAESLTSTERGLASVLADVMHVDRVPVDSHFFDDLGADSLVMAHFCARVRKRADLPSVSIKDVYRNQTVRSLAKAVTPDAPDPVVTWLPTVTTPVAKVDPAVLPVSAPAAAKPASRTEYVFCAALQLLTFLAYSYLAAIVTDEGYLWISAAPSLGDIYLRSVEFGTVAVICLCLLPVVAKWLIIGRWKPSEIRVWSLGYVRFWIVKTLVRSNPLLLFIGGRSRMSTTSPLYNMYLRALGAKVGRGAAIFSRNMPVCTDMLTIGDGAVVRKDVFFNGYRAYAGVIQTGAITLGKDAFVGEMTVLDINTAVGDGAQVGHASSLQSGQVVPDGESWSGSPAQLIGEDYRVAPVPGHSSARRFMFGLTQVLKVLLVGMPLVVGGLVLLLAEVPALNTLMDGDPAAFTSWWFHRDALIFSTALFLGLMIFGLLFVGTVPRLLNKLIEPGKVYRLYGFRASAHRLIARTTNVRFFTTLFGDTSYIVNYLRWIGYKLTPVVQTGCNFGMEVKSENPFVTSVGSGTVVADGLSIMNADYSSTSFRVLPASIGSNNFIGNWVVYPAHGRTGDNCLLATKVAIPVDGAVRANTGVLGSNSFEIPRSVQRDTRMAHLKRGQQRRAVAAKNRYDIASMGLFLVARWFLFYVISLVLLTTADLYGSFGAAVIAGAGVLTLLFGIFYLVLVERAVSHFQRLRPRYCSIYDSYFWWHERFWKLSVNPKVLDGTPFKNVVWRLLGVRLGARVFDDGCAIIEKTLTTVGDGCTLNAGSRLQSHSQEDGAFKSDHITIGAGSTLGVGSLVHYGVTMGEGAVLAPDSFLMKGEDVPSCARWGGNPAREIDDNRATVQVGGK